MKLGQQYIGLKVDTARRAGKLSYDIVSIVGELPKVRGYVKLSVVDKCLDMLDRALLHAIRDAKYAQNPHCEYCKEFVPKSEVTGDHVRPRKLGGTTCWKNVVPCCPRCNEEKGEMTVEEFLSLKSNTDSL